MKAERRETEREGREKQEEHIWVRVSNEERWRRSLELRQSLE